MGKTSLRRYTSSIRGFGAVDDSPTFSLPLLEMGASAGGIDVSPSADLACRGTAVYMVSWEALFAALSPWEGESLFLFLSFPLFFFLVSLFLEGITL